MTGPMMLLAFLSIVSGWVGIPEGFGIPVKDYFAEFVHPSEFASETLGPEAHPFSFVLAGISVVGGATRHRARLRALHREAGAGRGALHAGSPGSTPSWTRAGTSTRSTARRSCGRDVAGAPRARASTGGSSSAGSPAASGAPYPGTGNCCRRLQSGGVQNYALFILLSVLIIGIIAGAQYAFLVFAIIALITIAAFAVGSRL